MSHHTAAEAERHASDDKAKGYNDLLRVHAAAFQILDSANELSAFRYWNRARGLELLAATDGAKAGKMVEQAETFIRYWVWNRAGKEKSLDDNVRSRKRTRTQKRYQELFKALNIEMCCICGSDKRELEDDKKVDGELIKCGQCGQVKYCSIQCQVVGWKVGHKNACKKLFWVGKRELNYDSYLVQRCDGA